MEEALTLCGINPRRPARVPEPDQLGAFKEKGESDRGENEDVAEHDISRQQLPLAAHLVSR